MYHLVQLLGIKQVIDCSQIQGMSILSITVSLFSSQLSSRFGESGSSDFDL